MSDAIQSVLLALRILENLCESGGEKGVSQLARELESSKARIFRHLQTLCARGYVLQDEASQKYRIGLRVFLLGRQAGEGIDLVAAVRPALERLRDKTGQTAVLATVLDDQVVILDFRLGTNPIQVGLRPGTRFALHAAALGHVALAFSPPALLERTLAKPLPKMASATPTEPAALRHLAAQVRRQGWASAPDAAIDGINALAAPVRAADGSLAGMIAIFGPLFYVPAQPSPAQLEELLHGAQAASRQLGWRPAA